MSEFAYHVLKNGDVRIARGGRVVTTLRGGRADSFAADVERADDHTAQLLMARVTGNYKRGNEREGRIHPRAGR